MRTIDPKKINLSTQPKELLATMQQEVPVAWYQFRKTIGSTLQYQKHEDRLLDQALAERQSLVSDTVEWISKVGNRWITYVHTEYFPHAMHALATHVSFIYYETYASCGAFFPLYPPPSAGKKGKQKKQQPDGIIIYTDHFFYQMSERTGKKYRSKELIREFITTRDSHAMQTDDDGELVARFVGGYGFGKWWEEDGIRVCQVRTYLNEKGRDSLNKRQQRLVEKLDAYATIIEEGMYNPEVAYSTALSTSLARNPGVLEQYSDKVSPEELWRFSDPAIAADYLQAMDKRMEAIKTLGLEREMAFSTMLGMSYVGLMEKMLHMKLNEPQMAIAASYVSMECGDMIKKYARRDFSTASEAEQQEFEADFAKMAACVARRMKLRSMTEERIAQCMADMLAENKRKKTTD